MENSSSLESSSAIALPDLRIGNVHIGFPVVQAALSGYSDMAMRVIARRLGASYALCEVVLDKMVLQTRGRRTARWAAVHDDEHPVGGQLMGADPEMFGEATTGLVGAGFDVIDINFGCPVKKVLGRCRGGFHLSQPETALEIVSRVREAAPAHVPVSVKMRRGIDDTAESRDKFFQILDGAFARGVAAVTVHGRTVEQRYNGPSRWGFLRQVKQHVGDHTILGSGDLFDAQACLDMICETGVDGVTVARGAIGNPWVFEQARALAAGKPLPPPPSIHQQRNVIAEHYQLADEIYGEETCCRQMRKFGIKYSRLHPQANAVRDAFVGIKRPGQWQQVLGHWYAEDGPGQYPAAEAEQNGNCGNE
ncbi:MAG: tRNA-dihydrouridine synthase family protein [Pirellulales bacterium]|nr:tRNA-dihydrouridine synthase family protein [Pirellulales bacterium]